MKKLRKLALLASVCSGLAASEGLAAGYSSSLTATSGLANSYAGSVTGSHDISDLFYNPAATAHFNKDQAIVSMSYLSLKIDPDNVSATESGSPVNGAEVSNAGGSFYVPAAYLSHNLNDKTSLGFSINAPYAIGTKYPNSWAGRNEVTDSNILALNFNPSISHKLTEDLAIGAGVSAQRMEASLVFGDSATGQGKIKGSDWGYGFNLGTTYKLNDQIRFGLAYRSQIRHKLQGNTQVNVYGTNVARSEMDARLTTPESATFGVSYQASDALELVYDLTWTRWSRFNNLNINHFGRTDTINYRMNNSVINSVGANYKFNSDLLLRSGLAYEKDAVNNNNRQPSIPNGNKYWVSVGLNYKIANGYSVDATYLHQFFKAATSNIDDGSGNTFSAKYKNRVDVFSVALKKEF